VKPANEKENRRDRRKAENQTGKRQVVVVMRERDGRTLPFVTKTEAQDVALVHADVDPNATIHADEASHWDALSARFLTKRINHSEAYSLDGAGTNMAESFSLACVAQSKAFITISRASICQPMRTKWRGAELPPRVQWSAIHVDHRRGP
jgi:hypothetical protein